MVLVFETKALVYGLPRVRETAMANAAGVSG